jgi:hypothetical protein
MNWVVPSGPSTHSTAPSWQELLRSASKAEKVFAAGAQGPPEERFLAPDATARKGSAAFRRPTPNCRFCAYAVALIGVARFACRKPRNASRPRRTPASTIA